MKEFAEFHALRLFVPYTASLLCTPARNNNNNNNNNNYNNNNKNNKIIIIIKYLFNVGYIITYTENWHRELKLIKTNPSHFLP